MIEILKAAERMISDHGDVAICRSFAMGNPRDPHAGGFGSLVSIAETFIAPSAGFPMHPHRDMEIISYIADGQMAHEDSLGNGSVIATGEVQRMSAGTGIVHSEFNPSATELCRCLQIWILPATLGLEPSYEQKAVDLQDGIRPIDVTIHQDVALSAVRIADRGHVAHEVKPGRRAYLHIARGRLALDARHGAAEALLFELP